MSEAEKLLETYFDLKKVFAGGEVFVDFKYNPELQTDYKPVDNALFHSTYETIKRIDNPDTEEGGYFLVAKGPVGDRLFHAMKVKGNWKFFRIFGITIAY